MFVWLEHLWPNWNINFEWYKNMVEMHINLAVLNYVLLLTQTAEAFHNTVANCAWLHQQRDPSVASVHELPSLTSTFAGLLEWCLRPLSLPHPRESMTTDTSIPTRAATQPPRRLAAPLDSGSRALVGKSNSTHSRTQTRVNKIVSFESQSS